jgi:hypothetical protein
MGLSILIFMGGFAVLVILFSMAWKFLEKRGLV